MSGADQHVADRVKWGRELTAAAIALVSVVIGTVQRQRRTFQSTIAVERDY